MKGLLTGIFYVEYFECGRAGALLSFVEELPEVHTDVRDIIPMYSERIFSDRSRTKH